jgi:hypothetical protein
VEGVALPAEGADVGVLVELGALLPPPPPPQPTTASETAATPATEMRDLKRITTFLFLIDDHTHDDAEDRREHHALA